MNAVDVLTYGQQTVLQTLEAAPESLWETPGACGTWSIKNIIAHLASFEQALVDLLTCFARGTPETFVNPFTESFNDDQVAQRQHLPPGATLDELRQAHAQVLRLIQQIPPDVICTPGTLPWYGREYALDDLIVYMFYGHKREHSAQIAIFLDANRARQHAPHRV